jgi:ABC-type multidrug transport system fused ATPase/permease subunit
MPAPTDPDRTAFYAARADVHARSRDEQRQRSGLLARLRLATFLGAIAALVWWTGFAGELPAAVLTMALFGLFAILVVVHARVEDRAAWFEAMWGVNARGIAAIERSWDGLPAAPAPATIDLGSHPYAHDLDLFGRASLFQLLGPASTSIGGETLARWILDPAPPPEVLARQRAVGELSPLDDWREHYAAYGIMGVDASGESLADFFEWAEGSAPPLPAYRLLQVGVYVILAAAWPLLLLHVSGAWENGLWTIPLLLGMILSFLTAGRVSHAFDRAGAGERTLRRYSGIFRHIESQRFASAELSGLQAQLAATGRPASAVMQRLNRILGFADLRRGAALLHFPIQLFTLWDFHCLFAVERWRASSGRRTRAWFAAAGELDALSCLARLHRDNPDWTFPDIQTERTYAARGLGHPLIDPRRRVSNDVQVGPPGTVLLITGSNMSGKSTLLRALGLNALLAQCGAPVCAASLRLPYCDVQTSIRITDSLEQGVSYFMAALARLKAVVDAAERESGDRVLFYLLDEILQGTNSAERGTAVQAVARHLLDAGAIGAMTTHDLNIAMEQPLATAAQLVHFSEVIDERGEMRFDYTLRQGLATSRNAIRLMKLIGIEV